MTISTTGSRKDFIGDGVIVAFAFPFLFPTDGDLDVYIFDTVAKTNTLKTLTTDYTVTGEGTPTSGLVTMVTAPTSLEELIILRGVDITQGSAYTDFNRLPSVTIEANFDRLTMIAQQLQEQIDRNISFDVDENTFTGKLPAPLGDAIIGYNTAGTDFENKVLGATNFTFPTSAFVVSDGTNVLLGRTITAGTGISVSNGDGASGNPVITNTANAPDVKEYIYWASTGSPGDNNGIVIFQETKVRDRDGGTLFEFAGDVTLDLDASGKNGLDTGSPANNTWYAIVAIFDSNAVNAPAGLLVDAVNYPTVVLPSGYDKYRRIGWIRTNGSATVSEGVFVNFKYFPAAFLVAGSSVPATPGTPVSVDFSSLVPPGIQLIGAVLQGNSAAIIECRWEAEEFAGAVSARAITTVETAAADNLNVILPLDTSQSTRFDSDANNYDVLLHFYEDNLRSNV